MLNLNFIIRKVLIQWINKINQFFENYCFNIIHIYRKATGYFLNFPSFSFIITYKNNVLFPCLQRHQISQLVDFKFTFGFIIIICNDIILILYAHSLFLDIRFWAMRLITMVCFFIFMPKTIFFNKKTALIINANEDL